MSNLDKAFEVINSKIADTAVTLEGELFNSKGIIRGGAVSGTEGMAVGKKERIEKLSDEIWRLNKNITSLADELRIAREEYEAVDIKELTEAVRRAEAEKNQHGQKNIRARISEKMPSPITSQFMKIT